nr:putative reverse transcriptase domain, aspartic peptidase domain protein [Tanacetum cinerariifolium]
MQIISALQARTLLSHGCEGFLATIHDTTSEVPSIHDQPIVSEFPDVFPDELPGIPPVREVEFNIELIPGSERISKAPYRMAPIELKELKDQFQVTPKTSHLQAVKMIFRYLKGQPKLGLWYPKASSFNLEAYLDSDYAATLLKGRLLEVTTAKQRLLLPSIEEFMCWFSHHTINGYQFTMSNPHQELASLGANESCKELASPKQTALGNDESNPLIVDSLLKTIWSSMHHVIAMKHWLFQSKRLLQPKAPKVPSPQPSPEHQLPSPFNDQIPTAKDSLTLQELMELCTRLSNKVLDLESKVIDIKSSFTDRIQKLKDRVDQLEEENMALKEKSFKTT